jgi:hypothetical protein
MTEADAGIPRTPIRRLLLHTLFALMILVEWFAIPFLVLVAAYTFFADSLLAMRMPMLLIGIIFLCAAYFVPAAFLILSRAQKARSALNPRKVISIGLKKEYATRWLMAVIINLMFFTLTLLAVIAEAPVTYFVATFFNLWGIVTVMTLLSYVDTRNIE